jgi:predicted DNA-binding transcriptional regulator YafY
MEPGKPAGISEKVIRLLEIYTMIAQKLFPNVPSLREHFHVSERSVYRYLEIINMIDSIEYDQERRGYKFVNGDRIKKLHLSDNELLVLFAASEAVSHLGQPLGQGFQTLMEKVAVGKRADGAAKIPIMVKMPEAMGNEKLSGYFAAVSACLNDHRAIELKYKARAAKTATERVVDPYGLVFYDGIWMLIGYCHLRKEIRSFALDRILDLKERNLYFRPPEDFSLQDYFSHSWGVIEGEAVKIRVRFSSEVADYILRKKWHPSEERRLLANGDVEITFGVAGVDEIRRWIYSWLPHAEILEPSWLRDQAASDLAESSKKHA